MPSPGPDVAVPDVAVPDVAVLDAAVPDAAVVDAAVVDAAVPDVAVPDAAGPSCDAGRCGIVVARLIAPLSSATVSSRRPTLRFTLSPSAEGARVELCRDRACASALQSFDATGGVATPPSDLPPGVVFWRVRERVGSTFASATSATWALHVGARSAAVDTSFGTTLDVNGDGYTDLALGAPAIASGIAQGRAYVYLGGAGGLDAAPATTLVGPDRPGGKFGHVVASAGDVNGDGYTDLAVGAFQGGSGPGDVPAGRVYLYFGGPAGLGTTPARLVGPGETGSEFGRSVTGAGDVNRDGYADVLVGDPTGGAGRVGVAYLYLGGPNGLGATPATVLTAPERWPDFGGSLSSAGDTNGDGYADVAISARASTGRGEPLVGRAFVFLGGAGGLGAAPAATLGAPDGISDRLWPALGTADFDGDGYTDVLVGFDGAEGGAGRVELYAGSATGLGTTATRIFVGPDGVRGAFGVSVSGAGDTNGDGYADAIVGADAVGMWTGSAYLYLGGAAGLGPTPLRLAPSDGGGQFGNFVSGAGDLNRDGRADLVVGAHTAEAYTGRAYVYLGAPRGVGDTPAVTRTGPDGPGGFFAWSIAGSGP